MAFSKFLNEISNRFAELREGFIDHLLILTLVPVGAAIVLAIPLAVVVRERPSLRSALIGLSSIVQTIPSLAMLAFLLPLLGIGKPPAMALPKVAKSGVTPKYCWAPPGATRKPVMTSSNIRIVPVSLQTWRIPSK